MGKGLIVNTYLGNINKSFFSDDRDNCSEPYIELKKHFENIGYVFEGVNNQSISDVNYIFVWDMMSLPPPSFLKKIIFHLKQYRSGGSHRNILKESLNYTNIKKILFMLEPPSVCPENWDFKLHKKFDYIFTWDPDLVDNKKYFKIFLPNPVRFNYTDPILFTKKKLLVDISSNKFNNHERGLQKFRINTIKYFTKKYPDQFSLYGFGWNPTPKKIFFSLIFFKKIYLKKFKSYRGTIKNKSLVYSNYKFAIAYENIFNEQGYISLKIFDILRSKLVPIYLGSYDIQEYIPKSSFIDRRQFSNDDELSIYLENMSEEEYEKYIFSGKRFLESDDFQKFLTPNFINTINMVFLKTINT